MAGVPAMTNRVLLGAKGGAHGLWVSKPGVDVLTASSDDDLLIGPTIKSLQFVTVGTISDPGAGATRSVTIPNLGFVPLVLVQCDKYPVGYAVSGATLTVRTGNAYPGSGYWTSSGTIRYAVTNIPQPA